MLTFKEHKEDYHIIEEYLDTLTDEELEKFELNGIQEDDSSDEDEDEDDEDEEELEKHVDATVDELTKSLPPQPKRNPNSKVMKVKRSDTLKRHREYRKNKQTIKRQQAKYRKTSAFKLYKKKRDRMAKMGRTTRGMKIRTKKVVG